jgi:hypothetical protein
MEINLFVTRGRVYAPHYILRTSVASISNSCKELVEKINILRKRSGIQEVPEELEKFIFRLIPEVTVTETFAKLHGHNVVLDLGLYGAIITVSARIMDEHDHPVGTFMEFDIKRNTPINDWSFLEKEIDLKQYLQYLKQNKYHAEEDS